MKNLFLMLLSLTFSVCAFSLPADIPVLIQDVHAAAVICDVPDVVPDYFSLFAQEFKDADREFDKVFNFQKAVIMTYCNDFGQTIETLNSGKMVKRQCMVEDKFIFKQVPSVEDIFANDWVILG